MATTVHQGFVDFLSTLTPTQKESDRAISHRASIEACLRSNFTVTGYFRAGSFGNGTSISGYSDVDYVAGISVECRDSDDLLNQVRDVLDRRFPNTGVRRNPPAVRLPFGTDASETTEVTPGIYLGKAPGTDYRVYHIADGNGEWLVTSPDTHNAFVRTEDERLGRKLKPLVRFIKAWKYMRSVPMGSFYLELVTAAYAAGEPAITYSTDLLAVLRILDDNGLPSLDDPAGVCGTIQPGGTQAQQDQARTKLSAARKWAERACTAEGEGRIQDAFNAWDLVFNGQFSKYG